MAISITTDLVDVTNCDTTTTNGTFYRLNGPSAANPAAEPDAKRQNVACIAYKSGTSLTPTDTGGHFNHTTTFDVTNQHVYHWRNNVTSANANTKANRGLAFGLTNTSTTSTSAWSTTNYKLWFLDGSDTAIEGGWVPYCVDPAGTADVSAGTLTLNTVKNCGFISRQQTGVNTSLNNILVDAVRRGTGVTATASSAADVITLDSIFLVDTTIANAWGVLTKTAEIYYGMGNIRVGSVSQTNTCLFQDLDQVLVWRNQPVSNTLYGFTVSGASGFETTLEFGEKNPDGSTANGCTIRGAGTAVWNLVCNANTKFLGYASTFANVRESTLTSTSELLDCTFNESGTITTNGATITSCGFTEHTATQLLVASPAEMAVITNCTFTSPGTGHAIELTSSSATPYEFSGLNFNGYAATNGSTGNEAIFINVLSGTVTINYAGGNLPTYRLAAGSTATVTVTSSSTLEITGIEVGSEVRVYKFNTPGDYAGATQISGTESVGSSTYSFLHTFGGSTGYISIIKFDKVPYFFELTFQSGGTQTIPVSQTVDRTASNP